MDHKQMSFDDFRELLRTRLREVRDSIPEHQDLLARRAWEMVQREVPWDVVVAATRAGKPLAEEEAHLEENGTSLRLPHLHFDEEEEADEVGMAEEEAERGGLQTLDPRDLATAPAPPLRREVGRYERERLSATTRQAIRMARHARRWHEIRKMRSVLLNIDQGYLKRMLGPESDTLNQEINALLRSWAPLVRDRQGSGRSVRRRR